MDRLLPVKERLFQLAKTNVIVRGHFELHKYQRVEYTEMLELLVLHLAAASDQMQAVLVEQAMRSPPATHLLRP